MFQKGYFIVLKCTHLDSLLRALAFSGPVYLLPRFSTATISAFFSWRTKLYRYGSGRDGQRSGRGIYFAADDGEE
jgi:hypothetical protein